MDILWEVNTYRAVRRVEIKAATPAKETTTLPNLEPVPPAEDWSKTIAVSSMAVTEYLVDPQNDARMAWAKGSW